MLYISDIPLGFLGAKPDLGKAPLPALTWASLTKVPPVIVGMAAAMSGVYFIIGRRMRLQVQGMGEETPGEDVEAINSESSDTNSEPEHE